METPTDFLSLPPTVRRRIYFEAGVVVDADLALHYKERAARREKGLEVPGLAVFVTLSLVCRFVREEVTYLFFSANRFFIAYQPPVGVSVRDLSLGPLRRISPTALSALTRLTIHLHVAARKSKHYLAYEPFECPASTDAPLSSSNPQGQALLLEWQATLQRCALHIRPERLRLSLICDVADAQTARRITVPFEHLPKLALCQVRLQSEPDDELFRIARDAAMRATQDQARRHDSPPKIRLSFLGLPRELRLQILENTDLVTPVNVVTWYPAKGYYNGPARIGWTSHSDSFLRQRKDQAGLDYQRKCKPPYETCHPTLHQSCRPMECLQDPKCPHRGVSCWTCSHYGCMFDRCFARNNADGSDGCFCRNYHAAYSPRCDCWRAPTPLFLVCRTVCEDARTVFFSRNHFIVRSSWLDKYYHGEPLAYVKVFGTWKPRKPRHGGSIFLRNAVPSSALRYLRSLEIEDLKLVTYPLSEDPADQDWLRTVEYVKDKLNLRSLVLKVSFYDKPSIEDDGTHLYDTLARDADIDKLKGCASTLWPLDNLGSDGLQSLKVEFDFMPSLGEPHTSEYYFRVTNSAPSPETAKVIKWCRFENEREVKAATCKQMLAKGRGKYWVEGIRGSFATYGAPED